ncbi:zinc finger protein ZFP69 isoform X12 [Cephus cinctus]|uniref:Zinc finger protein ZFP69 isoform X12 n=1 Tax=Cephus cinctus TaxID=211228 RepID=A0AAJ7BMN6_CEPCN|nr:zinc finger protein ZFP69 isoform X12 [Cephus cinctus]
MAETARSGVNERRAPNDAGSSPAWVKQRTRPRARLASRTGVLHGKMSSLDYLDLCRLCLVKDRVSVPIFEGEGDVRQIFLKIAACLPVKVAREDKLPKKICDDCVYKVELFYQFWNTTANAEKQLLQWLGEVGLEEKQGYVTGVLNPSVMKQEQNSESRLDSNVMQQVSGHQDNMGGMTMIDNMGLGMPIMIPSGNQQQITSVPMDTSGNSVQTVRPVQQAVVAVAGPSAQPNHQEQLAQNQGSASATAGTGTNPTTATPTVVTASISHQDDEEDTTDEDENSDEECDADEGLPVKEESEEDPSNNRTIEPTTFVNVSLACDEAGPSGLQQQKITEMPEMSMPQAADGDPKSGCAADFHEALTKVEPDQEILEENQFGNVIVGDGISNSSSNSSNSNSSSSSSSNNGDGDGCSSNNSGNNSGRIYPVVVAGFDNIEQEEQQEQQEQQEQVAILLETREDEEEEEEEEYILEAGEIKLEGGETGDTERRDRRRTREKFAERKLISGCQGNYECDICGKRVKKKMQFLKHRENHERRSNGRCAECDKVFTDEEKLQKHRIKVHQQERPFQCILCGKCFKTEEFLKTHLKQHNKRFTCDICGISKVSGYDLRLHKKKHNQEYVTYCETCNKGFYTNQTLERHVLTHTGEKPFVCKICKTPYASAAYLNMHMKSHGEREKHKCSICNFESYWKAALKVHLKIHTGENQITCEICGKSVSSKTYLQIHMRIHSGEKPHVCEVCGKAFSVRKYLIVHLRTHTGERPYECKLCQKRFTQQGSLNSHIKSHNEGK